MAASDNYIKNVAIVGATGRIGSYFAKELLKTGKHNVTALTRGTGKNTPPEGCKVAAVDYSDVESVASALKGHDFLIITLSVFAGPEVHPTLVKAAAKAGVQWIMPNNYGLDTKNTDLVGESPIGADYIKKCKEVEDAGLNWVTLACGFWYEWSLALGEQWFGFNIRERKVTMFDDGKTKISVSTWDQCGKAMAAFLKLPIQKNGEGGASAPAVLEQYKNEPLYIASFTVSQCDMLDSLHRVLGTTDKDWEISYEPSEKRYKDGMGEMKSGIQTGFAKAMYSRTFYPDAKGDFETARGLSNGVLGISKESLDEATKRTVGMIESGWNPFAE